VVAEKSNIKLKVTTVMKVILLEMSACLTSRCDALAVECPDERYEAFKRVVDVAAKGIAELKDMRPHL
jgi:hypothetical protein